MVVASARVRQSLTLAVGLIGEQRKCMSLFSLEHGKTAYRADFALYGAAGVLLEAFLLLAGPRERRLEIVAFAWVGLASWTTIEYALHRFVPHRLRPFSRWHAEHHHAIAQSGCYGVISAFWDHFFGSAKP